MKPSEKYKQRKKHSKMCFLFIAKFVFMNILYFIIYDIR